MEGQSWKVKLGTHIEDIAKEVASGLRYRAEELESVAKVLEVLSAGMAHAAPGDVDAVVQGVVLRLLGIGGAKNGAGAAEPPSPRHDPCDVNARALAEDNIVVAFAGPASLGRSLVLGVDAQGRRRVLGLYAASSADPVAMRDAMADLYTRGLGVRAGPQLLWVVDDSQAIRDAIRQRWPGAPMALCRTTLERRVLGAVSEASWPWVRRALRKAFAEREMRQAQASLSTLEQQLADAFPACAEILASGQRAALLLKELGLPPVLETHLATLAAVRTADTQARLLGRPHAPVGEDSFPYGVEAWERMTRRVAGYEQMPSLLEALARWSQEAA